jgi:Mg2+/Co2+ transporter CorB
MSYEAVFIVVASLVDNKDALRRPELVGTEVSYWISFIFTLQKQPPVIGVILTHKDKLLRQQRSPGALQEYHASALEYLRDLVAQMELEIPFWSIHAEMRVQCSPGWLDSTRSLSAGYHGSRV